MRSRPTASSEDFDTDDEFNDGGESSGRDRSLKTKRLLLDLLGRWHWIVLGVILGGLGAAYYLSKAPKRYSASSTLLIKQQTSTVISKDQVEELDMRSIEGLNTIAENIRRNDLLDRVAGRIDVRSLSGLIPAQVKWTPEWLDGWLKHFKPGDGPKNPANASAESAVPAPAILSGYIGSWMKISIRRGTRLLDINIEHEVPKVAKTVADAIAREYLAEISGAITEGRSAQSDTLIKQSEEARAKLQAAEGALATYIRALELHKALEDQETVNAKLARRYLPKHPKMAAAMSELTELKKRFLEEFGNAMSAPSDANFWKTSRTEIEATKDDPDARLQLARQLLLSRTGVLQGETKSQMSVFNAMLTRLEESNVNRQGESSNVEISSFARVPGAPIAPVPAKVIGMGCGGGLALGLLFAFALIRMDNKFHSVAQLEEESRLPVLAAVSNIDVRYLDQAIKAAAKHGKEIPLSPVQEGWDPRLVFRPGTSTTNFAEMFRVLRASVSLLGDESKRKVTLFSSALPGEGKSLISANFATAAAGQGRKTLLIDLDLRKPSLHRVFGLTRSEQGDGITEWLAGQVPLEDVIQRDSGAENLHIIFSGKRAPNPGELLNADNLKRLFEEAEKTYDLIVVDSAPILAVPDTRVIAQLVDNFCLVVRAEYVPKGAVSRVLEVLESTGTPPSGLVFNGFSESRRMIGQNYSYGNYRMSRYGKAYQYGYGSYGAYGSDDADEDKEITSRRKKRGQS